MINLLSDSTFLILIGMLLTCLAAYIDLYVALSELQRIDQQAVIIESTKIEEWPL